MRILLMCALAATLCAADVAQATGTLTIDDRQLSVFMDLSDPGGTNQFPTDTLEPDSFGADFSQGIGYDGFSPAVQVEGEIDASQISAFTFESGFDFSAVSASGLVTGNAQLDDFVTPNSASLDGESLFDITFTITQEMDFNIAGEIVDSTSASGVTARVRMAPAGTTDYLFNFTTAGMFGPTMGTLPPGSYRLFADADVIAFAFDGVNIPTRTAGFDFDFTLVPEPGIGLMFAVACFAMVRRRPKTTEG